MQEKKMLFKRFFFFVAETAAEKEGWVGAVGKAMVRRTVMIDDD